jgi:tRNA dimethylallyltransferase
MASAPTIPLAIIGPTASGKSSTAMALAMADPRVEIISADSMQVYRGMDIGTAKPTAEEQAAVRHHLIDVLDPHEDYTVSRFAADVEAVVVDIVHRGGVPVLVGGTGLYVRAVVDDFEIPGQYPDARAEVEAEPDTAVLFARLAELDPVAASRMEPTNRRRVVRALEVTLASGRRFSEWGPGLDAYPAIPTHQLACDRPRPSLDARIDARYGVQMEQGFLEEVTRLAERPEGLSRTARQALGYRELLLHVEEGLPLDEALDLAKQRTRRFARRQQRWFRRDPRIEWADLDEIDVDALVGRMAALLASNDAR